MLTTIDVDDGERTYRLGAGTFLTTMLSVNNRAAAPGLEHFDPAHYDARRRLAPDVPIATKELVSTFGHGLHACPAARFSISAIRIAIRSLIDTYDLTLDRAPEPRRRQIGGIARAQHPVNVRYSRR